MPILATFSEVRTRGSVLHLGLIRPVTNSASDLLSPLDLSEINTNSHILKVRYILKDFSELGPQEYCRILGPTYHLSLV